MKDYPGGQNPHPTIYVVVHGTIPSGEWMNECMTGKRKLMIHNRITLPTFYLLFACTDAAATLKNQKKEV